MVQGDLRQKPPPPGRHVAECSEEEFDRVFPKAQMDSLRPGESLMAAMR